MQSFFGKNENKEEKITDKAFSRLLVTSVLGILVCIACLCSTTWAWFTGSAGSTENEIKTASECLLTVTVTDSGETLADVENGVSLEEGVTYTVTLALPADSASGYCLIETAKRSYYTEYIARHESGVETRTFTLTVEETQRVTFTTRWGIYSCDCDVVGGTLHIS